MSKFLLIVLVLIVAVVVIGGGVLMFWDIPAPTARIEHPIPDARLPH
jgi:small neutral amino acid transporter SnatA (MarC family)